jgi:6-phosphofructokinase 1
MERAFICHSSRDSKFVIEVCRFLKQNLDDIFYFEDYQRNSENARLGFVTQISKKIIEYETFIVFIGNKLTDWQKNEISTLIQFQNKSAEPEKKKVFTALLGIDDIPAEVSLLSQFQYEIVSINLINNNDTGAYNLARNIVNRLGLVWKSRDGLPPISNFFQYEKDIIKDYIKLLDFKDKLYESDAEFDNEVEKIRLDLREKILYGLPPKWPKVKRMPNNDTYHENTVPDIGEKRPDNAKVVAAALTTFHPTSGSCIYREQLTFPEAGPRELLFYPRRGHSLKVAILISGGIAPGINSVINGIVQRHELYAAFSENPYNVEIFGLRNGFYAFDDYLRNHIRLTSKYTSSVANESGSCIGTSRDDRLLEFPKDQDQCHYIISQLLNDNIDILYIIGGDGSMKAAHALWNYSKEMVKEGGFGNKKISVIGIPKTMDNDILWVWQTFGFLSAVEKAREIIEQLSAEVISNPRICIVQLFGSDSGFVVSHAVVASKSNVCDVALIPEVPFTMKQLANYLTDKIESQRRVAGIPMSLVVMAETAIPLDALKYINDAKIGLTKEEKNAIRLFIKTKQLVSINKRNDILRTAGLKIVSRVLKQLLPDQDSQNISWSRKRVFTNEPRHILRAISPSCSDTIMGNRLGTLAVDNALAGYSDFMISQWLTEYVMVPLKLVVLGKKRIPTGGIFWKSVTTKTGQPDLNVSKKPSNGRNKKKKK